jgi:hypothetical protein
MKEYWLPVKGLEGAYEVSNLGSVRSLPRETKYKDGRVGYHKGRILSQTITPKGYHKVYPTLKGKKREFQVHRLVAETFIHNPDRLPQVNHKNGDKSKNDISNLEWVTNLQNALHANENHLKDTARQAKPVAQYTKAKTAKERKLIAVYRSAYSAAQNVSGDNHKILLVCHGERKSHKGYDWEFIN